MFQVNRVREKLRYLHPVSNPFKEGLWAESTTGYIIVESGRGEGSRG